MKYKATTRFSTVVMVNGMNVYVQCDEDEVVDLEEEVVRLVEADIGKVLNSVSPKPKPKPKRNRQVTTADSDE